MYIKRNLIASILYDSKMTIYRGKMKKSIFRYYYRYGFVEFLTEEDADYSIKIMNMIKLYGKPIRVNKASAHQKNLDVGANIFIGNLDPEVDEKLLYDTFSAFGVILTTPKVLNNFPLIKRLSLNRVKELQKLYKIKLLIIFRFNAILKRVIPKDLLLSIMQVLKPQMLQLIR